MPDGNRLLLRRSSTASALPDPSQLEIAELVVNLADRRLYSKDISNDIIDLTGVRVGDSPTFSKLTVEGDAEFLEEFSVKNFKVKSISVTQPQSGSGWYRIATVTNSRREIGGNLYFRVSSGTGGRAGNLVAAVSMGNTHGGNSAHRISILSASQQSALQDIRLVYEEGTWNQPVHLDIFISATTANVNVNCTFVGTITTDFILDTAEADPSIPSGFTVDHYNPNREAFYNPIIRDDLEVDGRLGIGTSSPGTKLHIKQDDFGFLELDRSGSGFGSWIISPSSNHTSYSSNDALRFRYGGSDVFSVDSNGTLATNEDLYIGGDGEFIGDVGIGGSLPLKKLHITSSNHSDHLLLERTGTNAGYWQIGFWGTGLGISPIGGNMSSTNLLVWLQDSSVTIFEDLDVEGAVDIGGYLDINGDLEVDGDVLFSEDLSVEGDLTASNVVAKNLVTTDLGIHGMSEDVAELDDSGVLHVPTPGRGNTLLVRRQVSPMGGDEIVSFTGLVPGVLYLLVHDDGETDPISFDGAVIPNGGSPVKIRAVDETSAKIVGGHSSAELNVRNFGALGDGETDDVAAVQAAVDAAESGGGGTVFFPNGDYGDLSGVTVPSGVTLLGESLAGVSVSGLDIFFRALMDKDGKIPADIFPKLLIVGLRQGTKAELDAADPPLKDNEPAYETDAGRFRLGNVRYAKMGEAGAEKPADVFSIRKGSPDISAADWEKAVKFVTTADSFETGSMGSDTVRTSTGYAIVRRWDGTNTSVLGNGNPATNTVLDYGDAPVPPYDSRLPKMFAVLPCDENGVITGTFDLLRFGDQPIVSVEIEMGVHPFRSLQLTGLDLSEAPSFETSELIVLNLSGNKLLRFSIQNAPNLRSLTLNNNRLIEVRAPGLQASGDAHHSDPYAHYAGLDVSDNLLSASALNTMFEDLGEAIPLPPYNTYGHIYVHNNPGSATCDPSIATAKGYIVHGV